MSKIREIKEVLTAKPTTDGAGVKLNRVFGYAEARRLDPFLLLDDFRSDDPEDYIAGFPWHPHRGIETVTYMIKGRVRHEDSLGNNGVIGEGDIQWMTAGRGIVHQEMPEQQAGLLHGFQLWVNLPRSAKMMKPRYQEFLSSSIPEVPLPNGGKARVIAGEYVCTEGPVKEVVAEPGYMDVSLAAAETFQHRVPAGHTVFAYVFSGEGSFDDSGREPLGNGKLALFSVGA